MLATRIDKGVFLDPSWWHWALTVPLLAAHLSGIDAALAVAMMLCAVMAIVFWARIGGTMAMPVQVRIAYLALLAIGTAPGMAWIHWVQLVGTRATVTVGYCTVVRMLTLLPWNRSEPLSLAMLRNLALAPSAGGLWMHTAHTSASPVACSCSLHSRRQSQAGACSR
jgi:hypothetical protein